MTDDQRFAGKRPDVLVYETDVLGEDVTFAGNMFAHLFVSTSESAADWVVKLIDVYPDGREYFVVEGCVNARARQYARALVKGKDGTFDYHNSGFPPDEMEDGLDLIPFTNINIGAYYEYDFRLLPIAYTWGINHRMKVLISSSNYDRYQVNPNLPIEEGEFFRRKPGDGQKYTYQGVEMTPRVAVQRIGISDGMKSFIDLPVYSHTAFTSTFEANPDIKIDAFVYPNPASHQVSVYLSKDGNYQLSVYNLQGKEVLVKSFQDQTSLDVEAWDSGLYIFRIVGEDGAEVVHKVSVQ